MEKKRVIGGLILIAIGLMLAGQRYGWFYAEDIPRFLIPLGVIVLGIWLIMRKRRQEQLPPPGPIPQQSRPFTPPPPPATPPPPEAYSSTPMVNITAETSSGHKAEFRASTDGFKFSSSGRASEAPSQSFPGQLKYSKFAGDMFISFDGITIRNVEVHSAMGDIEINLRGAVLSPGLNRLLVSHFLGDVRILIPHELEHFVHLSNFAGDTEAFQRRSSGVGNKVEQGTANYDATPTKLYIAVNSFAGSTRIIQT